MGLSWYPASGTFQERSFALVAAGAKCAGALGNSSTPAQIQARRDEIRGYCERLAALGYCPKGRDKELQYIELRDLEKCFDNIDYRSVRQLSGTIRAGYQSLRDPTDWDVPPALLQQGLGGFSAVQRLVVELNAAGLIVELEKRSLKIATQVSKENLPQIDLSIIEDETRLFTMIEEARKTDNLSELSVDQISWIDRSELAKGLFVDPDAPTKWKDRQQLDESQRSARLRLIGIITEMLAGGLLSAANVGIAVLSTTLPTIPTLGGGTALTALAAATSARVGLVSIGKGFKELAPRLTASSSPP